MISISHRVYHSIYSLVSCSVTFTGQRPSPIRSCVRGFFPVTLKATYSHNYCAGDTLSLCARVSQTQQQTLTESVSSAVTITVSAVSLLLRFTPRAERER